MWDRAGQRKQLWEAVGWTLADEEHLGHGYRKAKGTPLILRKVFLEELLTTKDFIFYPIG